MCIIITKRDKLMENKFFNNIKGNFGFGMMRLPMKDDDVDYKQVSDMVDRFMECGFNYFDTAYIYLDKTGICELVNETVNPFTTPITEDELNIIRLSD